jgi:hypothetical protein
VVQAGDLKAALKVAHDTATASDIPAWRPALLAILVLLLAAACSSTPPSPRKTYDVSVDFLKLEQGQCMAVSSYTNRYDQPLRISGDIRLLGRDGKLIGNVPLITETLAPGDSTSRDHSLMQILSDADMARCRSIASYQVKVSLCRTKDGRYLGGASCIGERRGTVTW